MFTLRLEDGLYERVRGWCRERGVSMGGYIGRLVAESEAARGGEVEAVVLDALGDDEVRGFGDGWEW